MGNWIHGAVICAAMVACSSDKSAAELVAGLDGGGQPVSEPDAPIENSDGDSGEPGNDAAPTPADSGPVSVSPEEWFGDSDFRCCWRDPEAANLTEPEHCDRYCDPGWVATTRGGGSVHCVPDVGQCDPECYRDGG